MHVFIAGVMQGSRQDELIDDQDYRVRIATTLRNHFPDATITDPWSLHPESPSYNGDQVRDTFLENTALAGDADLVIAYLPRASMGTAIELWTAYHNHSYVIAVTPMSHNWVVRITADEILPDLDSLLRFIASGELQSRLSATRSAGPTGVDGHLPQD